MPGGRYECRYTSGTSTATAYVISSGPVGPIVNTAICDERNARRFGTTNFRICQRDDDGAIIPLASSIVCNAVYPQAGHTYTTHIVDEAGNNVIEASVGELSEPLIQTQKRYGPILISGRYRCLFSLDGNVVTEKAIIVR
jgi:hypothetical protein